MSAHAVRELLRDARQRVAEGWCQGRDNDGNGRVCMMGAIRGDVDDRAYRALRLVVDAPSITGWNDAPGRTQAEVIEVFSRAIEATL